VFFFSLIDAHEGEEKCMQCFGGEPKGNKPLRKPRRRWEDYIEIKVKKQDDRAFTGFVWQRIETCGRLL
jgi:hypothetical protein